MVLFSDYTLGDDVGCHVEEFAMARQECHSKGLISCKMNVTSQSSPGPLCTSRHTLRTFSDRNIPLCGVVSGGW